MDSVFFGLLLFFKATTSGFNFKNIFIAYPALQKGPAPVFLLLLAQHISNLLLAQSHPHTELTAKTHQEHFVCSSESPRRILDCRMHLHLSVSTLCVLWRELQAFFLITVISGWFYCGNLCPPPTVTFILQWSNIDDPCPAHCLWIDQADCTTTSGVSPYTWALLGVVKPFMEKQICMAQFDSAQPKAPVERAPKVQTSSLRCRGRKLYSYPSVYPSSFIITVSDVVCAIKEKYDILPH